MDTWWGGIYVPGRPSLLSVTLWRVRRAADKAQRFSAFPPGADVSTIYHRCQSQLDSEYRAVWIPFLAVENSAGRND